MEQRLSMLLELQEIDFRIRALTEKKNKFPQILASLERRRSENRQELEKASEALQIAQKNKRDRDTDLETGVQKVEKLKARTSEIKTNKEYQALLKEIEAAEKENKAIEDDILVLMEKIEAAAALIKTAESRISEEESSIASEQREGEAAVEKAEQELADAVQLRQEVTARMDSALLAQYQNLLEAKCGMALAEARMEACSGCYMSIPPQVFVNVKKNEDIITCPHCGRILYYKGAQRQ